MVTPDFSQKTATLYGALKRLAQDFPFTQKHKTSFSLKRGGFRLDFENGSELYLVVNRYVKYMAGGEFKASSSFAIYDGPVLEALRKVAPAIAGTVDNPWVSGSSWYLVPDLWARLPHWDYEFVSGVDIAGLSDQVVEDIKSYLFPPMVAFIEDYSAAADIFLDGDIAQLHINEPFAIGLAILKLAGRLDEAERLVARASAMKEKFSDYAPKKGAALIARFCKSAESGGAKRAGSTSSGSGGSIAKASLSKAGPAGRAAVGSTNSSKHDTAKKRATQKKPLKKRGTSQTRR